MGTRIQRSFAGGELSPALYGRSDVVKYATGVRTMRNMMVLRHGPAANRPGTKYICEVKSSAARVRLVRFVFNSDQTYVLEFGNLYMRVIRNGAQLTSGGSPYEIVTPYVTADLPDLQYVQSGDVVTIVHPSYAPRELRRSGHTSWSLTTVTTAAAIAAPGTPVVTGVGPAASPAAPTGFTAIGGDGGITASLYRITAWDVNPTASEGEYADATATVGGATAGSPVDLAWNTVAGCDGYAIYKWHNASATFGLLAIVHGAATLSFSDAGYNAARPIAVASNLGSGTATGFSYKVTSVDVNGNESVPSAAGTCTGQPPSTSSPNVIGWVAVTDAVSYNVYKEVNGVYGFIGNAIGTSFNDTGLTPDTTTTPPTGATLFGSSTNYPSTVAYTQQRQAFANTDTSPEKVWLSRVGSFKDFSTNTPSQDDDSISFTLAGREVNEVRHLIEIGGKLVVFTSGGEWTVEGDADGVIRPSAINLRQQGYNGSAELSPLAVTNTALFMQARGSVVRDLRFDYSADGYTGRDLTIFASHLFDGYTVADWTYAQIPHSVVWAVREDGALLGLTYVREHEVWGWHRHDTGDGDTFENVISVPEGDEDAVYVVVKRTINGSTKRYIERMATRNVTDVVDAFFVDCGLTYDGRNESATTMTLSGGTDWDSDEDLTMTASAAYFAAGDVDNHIILSVGDAYVRCRIKAFTSDQIVTVRATATVPVAFRSVAITKWTEAVDEVAGLSHLEGRTVSILADGNVLAQATVSGGSVSLGSTYGVVHVGLPIEADLETLDMDDPNMETMVDKKKLINRVMVLVEKSRGMNAGPDEDNLTEPAWRDVEALSDPTDLLTGAIDVPVEASWNSHGRVFVRQSDPLPLTVLAVAPSGIIGGR